MLTNLCLGSAQFGLDYGISNNRGKTPEIEVKKILKEASKNNIKYIDTAQSYENSEQVIGRSWSSEFDFKVISKLSCQVKNFQKYNQDELISIWDEQFNNSLKNLKLNSLEAFLLHNSHNLKGKNGDHLISWMETLKEKKLVTRIGISIYDLSDLDYIPLEKIDIIQVPLSIYDQRMLTNGTIDNLSRMGKSIQIRSIFLQGLILQKYSYWPKFISKKFLDHHKRFTEETFYMNMSMNYRILDFVSNLKDIEAILVGVTNLKEVSEIIKNWNIIKSNKKNLDPYDYSKWAWNNNMELDPRLWPQVK